MKYISKLVISLAAVMALCLASCKDDNDTPVNNGTAVVAQQDFTIDPNADEVEVPTVSFDATGDWTLYSDEIWCQLERDGVKRNSLSGVAGHHDIKVMVNPSHAEGVEHTATLRLKVGFNVFTVATVTLDKLLYRGMMTIDGMTYRSKDGVPVPLFESGDSATISANYDFVLRMPWWCLANGSSSMEGKNGVQYPVRFTFNDEGSMDQRYPIQDEVTMLSADGTIEDTFPISFLGMNKYRTEVTTTGSPFGWTINVDEQTYSHYNNSAMADEVLPTPYIPFSIAVRNDEVTFVHITQDDAEKYHFDTEVDYATIENLGNGNGAMRYSLKLKRTDNLPKSGILMAFANAAWDTIKADPEAALFEIEEDNSKSWKYATNNNYVVSWKQYHENNCPFSLIVDTRRWDLEEFVPEMTNEYDKLFGCNGAWVIYTDILSARLLIRLEGYEDNWFGNYVYAGFSPNRMKNSSEDLQDMGFEPQHDQLYDKPALFLFLGENYIEEAANNPMFIAFRKDGVTQLLVIKPL